MGGIRGRVADLDVAREAVGVGVVAVVAERLSRLALAARIPIAVRVDVGHLVRAGPIDWVAAIERALDVVVAVDRGPKLTETGYAGLHTGACVLIAAFAVGGALLGRDDLAGVRLQFAFAPAIVAASGQNYYGNHAKRRAARVPEV